MTSVFLAFGMLVVAGVVHWLWRNDRRPSVAAQTGRFRMKPAVAAAPEPARPRRKRHAGAVARPH
jgi:hypothetical protein